MNTRSYNKEQILSGAEATSTIDYILNARNPNIYFLPDGSKLYYYNIILADGTAGSIGKKKLNSLWEGKQITYTVSIGRGGVKIKEVWKPKT